MREEGEEVECVGEEVKCGKVDDDAIIMKALKCKPSA